MHPRIKEARCLAARYCPYLAAAIYRINPVKLDQLPYGAAMAVDNRWNLYYVPDRLEKYHPEQVATVLIHEIWHLMAKHHERLRDYPHIIANLGGDCAINSMLRSIELPLPKTVVLPEQFGLPDGKSAEFYCENLMKQQQQKAQSGQSAEQGQDARSNFSSGGGDTDEDNSYDGDMDDSGSGSSQSNSQQQSSRSGKKTGKRKSGQKSQQNPSDSQQPGYDDGFDGLLVPDHGSCAHGQRQPYEIDEGLPEAVQDAIIRHIAEEIKSRGDVSASLNRWAQSVLQTRVDWRKVFRSYISAAIADAYSRMDYTWSKPSRRQALTDVILPRLIAPKPSVTVLVDTSGSMTEAELGLALSEIRNMLAHVQDLHVYAADTEIHTAQRVFSPEQVSRIQLVGGGGTSMRNATFQILEQNRKRPMILVIITDGETDWPDPAKGVSMIALITTSTKAPSHIKTIHVTREDEDESVI